MGGMAARQVGDNHFDPVGWSHWQDSVKTLKRPAGTTHSENMESGAVCRTVAVMQQHRGLALGLGLRNRLPPWITYRHSPEGPLAGAEICNSVLCDSKTCSKSNGCESGIHTVSLNHTGLISNDSSMGREKERQACWRGYSMLCGGMSSFTCTAVTLMPHLIEQTLPQPSQHDTSSAITEQAVAAAART